MRGSPCSADMPVLMRWLRLLRTAGLFRFRSESADRVKPQVEKRNTKFELGEMCYICDEFPNRKKRKRCANRFSSSGFLVLTDNIGFPMRKTFMPVSYTHLDVYKRQTSVRYN